MSGGVGNRAALWVLPPSAADTVTGPTGDGRHSLRAREATVAVDRRRRKISWGRGGAGAFASAFPQPSLVGA